MCASPSEQNRRRIALPLSPVCPPSPSPISPLFSPLSLPSIFPPFPQTLPRCCAKHPHTQIPHPTSAAPASPTNPYPHHPSQPIPLRPLHRTYTHRSLFCTCIFHDNLIPPSFPKVPRLGPSILSHRYGTKLRSCS